MVQTAERMHEAGGEGLRRAVPDMGERGRNAEDKERDNREDVHDVGTFQRQFYRIGS